MICGCARLTRVEWAVPSRIALLEGVAAGAFALAGIAALISGDRVAAVVAGIAALILSVVAIRDRVARVRLSADAGGVTVLHGFAQRARIPWSDIVAIGLEKRTRRGRSGRLLEIDTGETVYLLSGREMGAEPTEVAALLDAIRP